jgi:hypothetical protein
MMMIAIPQLAGMRDRMAVRGASSLVFRALADARDAAMRMNTRVAVTVDTARSRMAVRALSDTIRMLDLREAFGTSLSTSRDSIAYAANGLGYGAANSRYIVRRGHAAESLTVSRLGRVKR